MTPRLIRWVVAAIALSLLIVPPPPPPPPVEVTFAYSTDAEPILVPAIQAFNDAHAEDIHVNGVVGSSGKAEADIASGKFEPTVWMPASSAWARLLESDAPGTNVPDDNPSFFWSPIGVATGSEIAVRFDKRDATWHDIFDLATGKADIGLSRDIAFRYGHTKSTTSTSGLFAAVAESAEERARKGAFAEVERSVAHYGDIGNDYCPLLEKYTNLYVSAAPMQETVFKGCTEQSQTVLDMELYYPGQSAFVADYPCIALDAAEQEQEAARELCGWLGGYFAEPDHASRVEAPPFLRPGVPPWGGTFQSDPPSSKTISVLAVPRPEQLVKAREEWTRWRKHANVLILADRCDTSSAQVGNEADLVNQLLHDLDPGSRASVVRFSSRIPTIPPLKPANNFRDMHFTASERPGCQLYGTIGAALKSPQLRQEDRINVIVVASRGVDTRYGEKPAWLRDELNHRVQERDPIQVITVVFGQDGVETMRDIADEAHSQAFPSEDATTNTAIAQTIAKAL